MAHGSFCTAINCMDGRVQAPVADWLKGKYHVDYVDVVTEPGPDKVLALSGGQTESIKARVMVSVKAHGSEFIAIAAHHDCAGNPVSREQHLAHLKEAVRLVKSWRLPVKDVVALWIDEAWKPQPVDTA